MKPIYSHEKAISTKVIDFITKRVAGKEKIPFNKLDKIIKSIPELNLEFNHTYYSEGAPINTYFVRRNIGGNLAMEEFKACLEYFEHKNPRGYVFEVTKRRGKTGLWIHTIPYDRKAEDVPLVADLFTSDYRGVFGTKPILGKLFCKN